MSLSLYPQGEGGVQTGRDGEDFCQVSDLTGEAQIQEEVGVRPCPGVILRFIEMGQGWGGELAPVVPSPHLPLCSTAAVKSPPAESCFSILSGGSRVGCVRQKYRLIDAVTVTMGPVRGRAASCWKYHKSQLPVLREIEPGGVEGA